MTGVKEVSLGPCVALMATEAQDLVAKIRRG